MVNAAIDVGEYRGIGEDKLGYGNDTGLGVLEEIEEAKAHRTRQDKKMKALQEEFEMMKVEQAAMKVKQAASDAEIRSLAAASEGYLLIRERFLSTFRRDILGDTSHQSAIVAGNQAAHHGDAETDALLYEKGRRSDRHLYYRIYGLAPEQILNQSKYVPSPLKCVLKVHRSD